MLQIDSLKKSINNQLILNSITLNVNEGSIHGLIGNNGAGKSTLFKTIMGIYKLDSGSITWNNNNIYENPDTKCHLYLVPDQLIFKASETVKSWAKTHKNLYPKWSQSYFESLVSLTDFKTNTRLKSLSKGKKRLFTLCVALSTMSDVLLLDEPFDGLDPTIRKLAKKLIINEVASRNLSILISSHQLQELEDLCDTITLIHDGELKHTNELDHLKSKLHKIQISFNKDNHPDLSSLDLMTHEQSKLLDLLIVRGDIEDIESKIKLLKPTFYEIIPITLEELFIYEMEDYQYEFKQNIQ